LNIAEGNGKGADADRRRFFAMARGSVSACGSIRDCPDACKVRTAAENVQGGTLLIRIVSMPTKVGRRSHEVRENRGFARISTTTTTTTATATSALNVFFNGLVQLIGEPLLSKTGSADPARAFPEIHDVPGPERSTTRLDRSIQ
jgi:hypothetical protein